MRRAAFLALSAVLLVASAASPIFAACPQILVGPVSLPNPATGTSYTQTISESGAASATFSVTSGVLPTGLNLINPTATSVDLSGTPTQTGTFTFTLTATDATGCTGGRTYRVTVACGTITVNNPGTSSFPIGQALAGVTFTQMGATGTATFTLASGTLPMGVMLQPNGNLTGTPTQSGSFPITVMVTDSAGCTGTSGSYNLQITCPTITVNNPGTSSFTAGQALAGVTFTQMGGVGTTNFTLATGSLPMGVMLQANGNLTGTPTQTGMFPITVTATDSNGCTGTGGTYNLQINCQTITVTNPATSTFTVGQALAGVTFTQMGGIGTTNFTLASGSLPMGVMLQMNGSLTGTPTQTGMFPITVKATDSNGCTGTSGTYNLQINCPTITVNPSSLSNGLFMVAYGPVMFSQTGSTGTPTATSWSATGLPAGITINALTGAASGTPTTTVLNAPVAITYTDSFGCSGTRNLTLSILPNAQPETFNGGVGNTQYIVAASDPGGTPHVFAMGTVLSNDVGPGALFAGPAVIMSMNGGTVAMAASGTFTYTPAVGFAGASDSFTYTLTDGNAVTNTTVVTINLTGVVWYVNNTIGVSGDGRSQNPFKLLSDANGPAVQKPQPGQIIYVHTGVGNTTGNLGLQANQMLIGNGAALSVGGLSLAAGTFPTLGGTLTLANTVTVNGIDMSTGASNAIVNTAAAVTGVIVTPRTVTTSSGAAVNINPSSGTVTGTITFQAINVSGAPAGIILHNSSATFAVNGVGATAGSGGTVQNCATRGAEFVNASNITLSNMNLVGNGTAGTGVLDTRCADALNQSTTPIATVQGLNCQANVYLLSTTTVSLNNVKANQSKAIGIWGNNVNGLTLATVEAQQNGDEILEDGVQLVNELGAITVTGGIFKDNASRSFEIQNNSGTAMLNITGGTFGNTNNPGPVASPPSPSTATAGDTILLATNGTNGISLTSVIKGAAFANIYGRALNVNTEGNTSQNVTFGQSGAGNGNTVSNVSYGTDVNGTTSSSVTYNIVNNTFTNSTGVVTSGSRTLINARKGLGATGTWTGTVSNNVIGTVGVPDSGCDAVTCGGISLDNPAISGLHDMTITGNTIRRVNGDGIFVANNPGSASTGTVRATITGNTMEDPEDGTLGPGGNQGEGVFVASVGAGATINVKAGGPTAGEKNTVTGNWHGQNAGTLRGVRFSRGTNTAFCVSGYSGPFDSASVGAFITTQNTGNPGSATQSLADGLQYTGPACPTP